PAPASCAVSVSDCATASSFASSRSPRRSSEMKLKKGDTVRVITGKDKGKEGVVQRVIPADNKVIVSGVNIAAKHQRARRANEQGGIIDKDMPIHASNVMFVHK